MAVHNVYIAAGIWNSATCIHVDCPSTFFRDIFV